MDARSDIYALGLVLSQMATGRHAGIDRLPAVLEPIVRRCLEPDPEERWQSAKDVKQILEWARQTPPLPQPRATARRVWAFGLVALIAAAAVGFWIARNGEPAQPPLVARLAINPPENKHFYEVAVSPDGMRLAFTAAGLDGKALLWVRSLDSNSAEPLADTEGAKNPFWSPDNRWIGFFAANRLKKIAASGGSAQVLANAPTSRGGTWASGRIVFAPRHNGPLYEIPENGGEPRAVTDIEPANGENSHRWPQFLPDGRHFLFLTAFTQADKRGIYAGSVDSKQKVRLMVANASAEYAGSVTAGRILFLTRGILMAQAFDPAHLRTTGEAVPVTEPVGLAEGWHASFSASSNVLVYNAANRVYQELGWFDRSGAHLGTIGSPAVYLSVVPSPDERRAAVRRNIDWPNPEIDIWLTELSDGSSSRFTFNRIPPAGAPVWGPKGDRIVFANNRADTYDVYEKSITGVQEEKLRLSGVSPRQATDWSRDGRYLLFQQYDAKTRWDVWVLPMEGRSAPVPFQQSQFDDEGARFSPDGKWVAYQSNESGKDEVYVKPFSYPSRGDGGARWQISSDGGVEPTWRRDGKELFYIAADRRLMAVPVTGGATFHAGPPRALFQTRVTAAGELRISRYAPIGDGRRFLVLNDQPQASTPAGVILNWQSALQRKR